MTDYENTFSTGRFTGLFHAKRFVNKTFTKLPNEASKVFITNAVIEFESTSIGCNQDVEMHFPNCKHLTLTGSFQMVYRINFESL